MRTLHWSSVLTFSKCAQKYHLTYNEHLRKKAGKDSRAMILGSHVHAGIAAALVASFKGMPDLLTIATTAVRRYQNDTLNPNQTVYDYDLGREVPDESYRLMMQDILVQATAIVRYQLPKLGLGVKYRVASVGEVLHPVNGDAWTEQYSQPFVEFNFKNWLVRRENGSFGMDLDGQFTVPLSDKFTIEGTVDAVLRDLDTGAYIIIDWKTRKDIPDERLIDLDGQLKLYAAWINTKAGDNVITSAIQWQFRSTCPKPVKLTTKNAISLAQPGSTWAVWSASVRAMGEDPEQYRAEMEPKMQPEDTYSRPVESPITRASTAQVVLALTEWGSLIDHAELHKIWPMMPSSMGCQFCPFKRICQTRINGGDVQFVKDTEFEIVEDTDLLDATAEFEGLTE